MMDPDYEKDGGDSALYLLVGLGTIIALSSFGVGYLAGSLGCIERFFL